jgi:hypothetical protein
MNRTAPGRPAPKLVEVTVIEFDQQGAILAIRDIAHVDIGRTGQEQESPTGAHDVSVLSQLLDASEHEDQQRFDDRRIGDTLLLE